MNPALETLLLAFAPDGGLPVPDRALFLGAEPHPELAAWPQVAGWQPFRPKAVAWEAAGFERRERPEGRWPAVLVLPGKSREEALAWFALAREHAEPGGTVVAAMPNGAGAARFEKELAQAAGNIVSVQKHKCRAFAAVMDERADEEKFAAWRALAGPRAVPDTAFVVEAGVFSTDHVDPGSALLAATLPASLKGQVADLGAGWGFLAETVLRRCPHVERVDLFEADARALDCARRNLRAYAEKCRFHWHDVTEGVAGAYDAVVMNPPFHTGQATDVGLGRSFVTAAAGALKRGGTLYLVANRRLPYEPVLESCGLVWRNAGENAMYKLLFAQRR